MKIDAQMTNRTDERPKPLTPSSLYFIGPFILMYITDGKTKTDICKTKTTRKEDIE